MREAGFHKVNITNLCTVTWATCGVLNTSPSTSLFFGYNHDFLVMSADSSVGGAYIKFICHVI